jgi:phospholipid/cholesterol/gamma-HCH transport system substrate-binding protein
MSRIARLGLFILGTLGILAAGVFIIGSKHFFFSSTYVLKTEFENVAGLAEGADVQMGGVHCGNVLRVELPHQPAGKVTVVMELAQSTHEIVKQDSIASIETEGVLGNQYLSITFGSAGQADVKDGDKIGSVPPLEISALFKKASGILDSTQQAVINTTAATAHLNSLSAKIDSGQGTVGELINDKTLYNNLEDSTSKLKGTMVQAQAGVTDFQENMEALKHNFLLSGYFKKRGYEDSSSLTENQIDKLPATEPMKSFTIPANEIFSSKDVAKLKNEKGLKSAGEYLAANHFGVAVIVASAGMEGDSQKELVLTQARAMEVRDYLVGNYAFDDSQLKTLGLGKQPDEKAGAGWGTIQILVYAEGTAIAAARQAPGQAPVTVTPVPKQQ